MDYKIENVYVYVYCTNDVVARFNETVLEYPNIDIFVHEIIDDETGEDFSVCYMLDNTPITPTSGPYHHYVNKKEGIIYSSGNGIYTIWFKQPNLQKAKYYIYSKVYDEISNSIKRMTDGINVNKKRLEKYTKLIDEVKI